MATVPGSGLETTVATLTQQLEDARQHVAVLTGQLEYQRQAMALDFQHAVRQQLGRSARDCAVRFTEALRERPTDATLRLLALHFDHLHRQILRLGDLPPTEGIPGELLRGDGAGGAGGHPARQPPPVRRLLADSP